MNFLVRTYDGRCIVRPDISFNRDSGDYYVPEDVESIGYAPAVVAHLVKTGKMVGGQFAARYYDTVTFGILLYPGIRLGNGVKNFCIGASSCFDNTTVIPQPLFLPTEIDENGIFSIRNVNSKVFESHASGFRDIIAAAIVDCSNHSLIRKGDYVMAELNGVSTLCSREDGDFRFNLSVCGNITADIEIKF